VPSHRRADIRYGRDEPFLPYGRHSIDAHDIEAVVEVLNSDWLTTGPKVAEFEQRFAHVVGARQAVAVSSGTAALHAAMHAAGVRAGDEVIVPAMTFAASANAVVYQGGRPVFADVDPDTLLIDPVDVSTKISPRTRAILAVDYAGQPCDYVALRSIADANQLTLIADACHSLGGSLDGRPVGTLADLTAFSLHPVKHVTTGEGGMVTTDACDAAVHMRQFRNHGISRDSQQRAADGSWRYDIAELGYNYRLTDFQSALGISQLNKLPGWIARRQAIARRYDDLLSGFSAVESLKRIPGTEHAWHLYVIRLHGHDRSRLRGDVFRFLRARRIGVNVHYLPVHLHTFYRRRYGTYEGMCPHAEAAYEAILSLPIFPAMTDDQVDRVATSLNDALGDCSASAA